MDSFTGLCHSYGVPKWIIPLLRAASRHHTDKASRKKVYKLLQRKLVRHGVGIEPGSSRAPTYVYPQELKAFVRAVFPEDLCSYPDPSHVQVVYVTMEDLFAVDPI